MTPFTKTQDAARERPLQKAACALLACALVWPFAVQAQSLKPQTAKDGSTALVEVPVEPVTVGQAEGSEPVTGRTPTLDAAAIAAETDDGLTTGAVGPENLRQATVDGLRTVRHDDINEAPGLRLGTFILKPSLTQSVATERTKAGSSDSHRTYLETGLKGTLTSDWSLHQLTVTGDGAWQKTLSGIDTTEPRADINAELRLDISNDTTGTLTTGYNFEREESTDPNAISGATVQSGINRYSFGAGLKHDFGILRGSVRGDVYRYLYGDAELADGSTLSLADRDRWQGTLTSRVGYELSPALIPFLEAAYSKGAYDLRQDSLGYERDFNSYAGRAGVEVDLGEKLRGELAAGYERTEFEDARLAALGALTIDGTAVWSPQRGTDVNFGLATDIEPSTTAGQSGSIVYTLRSGVTHELSSVLTGRLSNSVSFRNYPSANQSQDQTIYTTGAGISWNLSRYLALNGDVSYELTKQNDTPNLGVARAGIGLTLRR
ncbi:outer membrane beta-barrel protein [Pararhizobium sp.]|uniref:outer membrane beta-barrel protein n=1 Tax=Pararhizobium sp. TaxID=1977563 RepID=UPI0027167697|nr:outer membrane beta-barrel protein [Pararhizobium sp.]MDO9417303.1 outer membrane beta-barrel protein [Pararhizobium sp.]